MNQTETILGILGGWDNIIVLEAYITRIRAEVKDDRVIDGESLHDAEAFGIVAADKSIQVVMGPGTEAIVGAIETLR